MEMFIYVGLHSRDFSRPTVSRPRVHSFETKRQKKKKKNDVVGVLNIGLQICVKVLTNYRSYTMA